MPARSMPKRSMPARSIRGEAGSARSTGGVAGVLLAVGLLVALAAAAMFVQPLLVAEGADSVLGVAVLGGVAVVVLLVVVVSVAVRRGRRQRAELARAAMAWFDELPAGTAEVTRRAAARPEAKAERSAERVLRMQVASLERALEGQDERVAQAVREEHRKTLLTIAALRQALAHEPGDVALNRLEAALARLGVTPDFTRPALPEGRTGAPVVFLGAPQPLVPAPAAPDAAAQAPAAAAPADAAATSPSTSADLDVAPGSDRTPGSEPTAGSAPAPDVDTVAARAAEEADAVEGGTRPGTAADTAPIRPVVKPVPAPVRPSDPHRRGRRLRRSTSRV